MYSLGFMQGRLSPSLPGIYQAFPVDHWRSEFLLAESFQLDHVEWIIDLHNFDRNPLISQTLRPEVSSLSKRSGVSVKSVCADFLLQGRLLDNSDSYKVLIRLLETVCAACFPLEIKTIVLPFVETNSLLDKANITALHYLHDQLCNMSKRYSLSFALELDLPPKDVCKLLDTLDSNHFSINYDTGNSASLGFNPLEELDCYGCHISDIHLKDRLLNGGPVLSGTGNTYFDPVISFINAGYESLVTYQFYKDTSFEQTFSTQHNWFSHLLNPPLAL